MRIAHVITRMIIGGAQENTLLTCQMLSRQYGDQVLLVSGPSLGPEGNLVAGGAGGVRHEVIDSLRREITPRRDWISYHRLKRLIQDFNPDVVHTHSAKAGILGRMAATAARTPVVVHTVHGAPFHPYQTRIANWFGRRAERFAAGKCHHLIGVSRAMTQQLVAAGVAPESKFSTVYSAVDVDALLQVDRQRDAVRRDLGYDSEQVVVGKIARLFHLKGHRYLVQAASRVVKQHPHARFLLVGDGILRKKIETEIRQAGLGDYFRFTGLVAPEEIPRLIAAMDLLVHASLREGLARALPQALIAGKPVVSFDVDGARDVVLAKSTGLLVAPRDVAGLTDAICRLVDDPASRREFGDRGRKLFAEQFRSEKMVRDLRAIYVSLLDSFGDSAE